MTILTTKILGEILEEGIELVPIFADFTCSSFKVGFYYNGIPHAIWKDVYGSQDECQSVINCMLAHFNPPLL